MSDEQGIQPTENPPAPGPPPTGIVASASGTPVANAPGSPLAVAPNSPLAEAPVSPVLEAAAMPAILEKMDVSFVVLLLVLSFFLGSYAATNPDAWLQLASGRLIAQGEWNIGVDPFSFTTEATATSPAVYWVHQSWLYSWVLYLIYSFTSGAGVVVAKALAIAGLAWCLLQIPGGKQSRWLTVIYVGLGMLALSPRLVLQPTIVSFLLLTRFGQDRKIMLNNSTESIQSPAQAGFDRAVCNLENLSCFSHGKIEKITQINNLLIRHA